MPKSKQILKLIVSILVCQMAGAVGWLFTSDSVVTWHPMLNKPSFNPPAWIFGPVWTTLYLMMGIALFLIWNSDKKHGFLTGLISRFFHKDSGKETAIKLFMVQLVLNALWSVIFFGMQQPGFAFLEILFLFTFIALTFLSFWKQNKAAGLLMLPYLYWVGFATVLNFAIWQLNI